MKAKQKTDKVNQSEASGSTAQGKKSRIVFPVFYPTIGGEGLGKITKVTFLPPDNFDNLNEWIERSK